MRRLALLVGLLTALSACGPINSIPDLPSGDVQEGAVIYQQRCASCHGADMRGTDSGPSHLSQFYKPSHHADHAFRAAIANGVPPHHWNFGPMPPVTGMTEAEIESVITFIRSEQDRLGFDT